MLASVLLSQVGGMLNDMEAGNEHVRWPEFELMNYITEATAAILQSRPSVFIVYDNIDLRPGTMQRVPDGFNKLVDIHFNINPDGSEGFPIFPGVHELQHYFTKAGCSTGGIVHTWSMLHGSNRTYEVHPSVPFNLNYTPKVRAVLLLNPDVVIYTNQIINIPDSDAQLYQGALVNWMLYRAYSKDQESAASMERSKLHLAAFNAYLGMGIAQPQRPAPQPRRETA